MVIQCPYCDSVSIDLFYGDTYRCRLCGKLFVHHGSKDVVLTT